MKPLPLILAFLPLVAYSLLARLLPTQDFGIAALVAAVIAVVVLVTVRPIWPPKVIQATSFVMFTGLAIAGFVAGHGDDRWLSRWAGGGAAIVMGLVILILLPVIPFTEQFARAVTPRKEWGSPVFVRINRVLSAAWGVAIVVLGASRVVAAIIDRHNPHPRLLVLVFSAVIPLVIIIYMLQFSKTYPDRVTHKTA
jgi:MFS family permease